MMPFFSAASKSWGRAKILVWTCTPDDDSAAASFSVKA
jgi:hypothetical protein